MQDKIWENCMISIKPKKDGFRYPQPNNLFFDLSNLRIKSNYLNLKKLSFLCFTFFYDILQIFYKIQLFDFIGKTIQALNINNLINFRKYIIWILKKHLMPCGFFLQFDCNQFSRELSKFIYLNISLKILFIIFLTIFTLRNLFLSQKYFPKRNQIFSDSQYLMLLYFLLGFALIFLSNSHILMPPFLPIAYKSSYYQQKFKISQLSSAQFKISGLPKDIFWTTNGTIFGTSTIIGQWKLTVSYQSVTQSGTYQTLLIIRQQNAALNKAVSSTQYSEPLSIQFPNQLIFQVDKIYDLELKLKNGKQPISWKVLTLPKGLSINQDGKLNINISKQGIYLMHVQAIDSNKNSAQGCMSINVQKQINNLSQLLISQRTNDSNQMMAKLVQISTKENQLTRNLSQAAKRLGKDSQILNQNLQSFKKVSNNLIQLQNQAKILALKMQNSLKEKLNQQKALKQAENIVQNAEQIFNLALIQQRSNNNLLIDAQKQKQKAQVTYQNASKILQSQVKVITDLDKKILQQQQLQQNSTQTLSLKRVKYTQLGNQILQKQKQIAILDKQILKSQQQAHAINLEVTLQQQILNQQETKSSILYNSIKTFEQKNKNISKQILKMNQQREAMVKEMIDLDRQVTEIKNNELINLQIRIKNNDLLISHLLVTSAPKFSEAVFQSSFIQNYFNKTTFEGCNNGQYPAIEGIFRIKKGSILQKFYITQNGYKILFGNCTKMPKLKQGDQIVFNGYASNGALHADTISPY